MTWHKLTQSARVFWAPGSLWRCSRSSGRSTSTARSPPRPGSSSACGGATPRTGQWTAGPPGKLTSDRWPWKLFHHLRIIFIDQKSSSTLSLNWKGVARGISKRGKRGSMFGLSSSSPSNESVKWEENISIEYFSSSKRYFYRRNDYFSTAHETPSVSFPQPRNLDQQICESVESGKMSMSPPAEPESVGRRHSLNPVHIPEFIRRVSLGPMSRRLSLRNQRRKSRSARTVGEEMGGASISQPHLKQNMKRSSGCITSDIIILMSQVSLRFSPRAGEDAECRRHILQENSTYQKTFLSECHK